MKIKKILPLILSVTSLNLATNFTNCFSMTYDNSSVTSVAEIRELGLTNCPICGSVRRSKTKKDGTYSTRCPHCSSISTGKKKETKRRSSYKKRMMIRMHVNFAALNINHLI